MSYKFNTFTGTFDLTSSGGGLSIGSPVISGTPGSVLFIDASGNLGQNNSQFFRNNTTGEFNVIANSSQSAIIVRGDVDGGTGLVDPLVWKNSSGVILGTLGGFSNEGMFALSGDSTDGSTGGQVGEWTVLDRNRTHFGSDKRIMSLQVRNLGMNNDDSTPYDMNISQAGYPRAMVVNLTQRRVGVGDAFDSVLPINIFGVSGNSSFGSAFALTTAPPNGMLIQDILGVGLSDPSGRIHSRSVYVAVVPSSVSASFFITAMAPTYNNGDSIDYKAYSFQDSPTSGTRYYSDHAPVTNYVTGSIQDIIQIDLTIPSGMKGIRLLRQVNGGGYNDGADFTASGTYYDDNLTGQITEIPWDGGSTTVAPNPLVDYNYAGIFEGGLRVEDQVNAVGLEINGVTPIYFTNTAGTHNVFVKGNHLGDLILGATIGGTISTQGDAFDTTASTILASEILAIDIIITTFLRFGSGALLVTPLAGTLEFLTDDLYFTQTTSTIRHNVAWQDNPISHQIFS